jgi:VanZ family protein
MKTDRIILTAAVLYTAGIAAVCALPAGGTVRLPAGDRTLHILLFIPLGILVGLSLFRRPLAGISWIICAGAAGELIQLAVPGRYAGWWDFAADCAGGIPAYAAAAFVRSRFYSPGESL